jgi:hypothetical protein
MKRAAGALTRGGLALLLLGGLAAGGSGCAQIATAMGDLNPLKPKPKPHVEVLSQAEWNRLKADNARRLAGEGVPRQASATQPASTQAVATPAPVGAVEGFGDFVRLVFWEGPKRLVEFFTGNTAGKYARMMEDDKSADTRRTGVMRLVSNYSFARADPYTKRYWQIAQGDPDYMVRVAAIRALNRSRDRNAVGVFVKALDDPNPLIRMEAAKALANVPDESAIPVLLRHLRPEIDIRPEGAGPGVRPERINEGRDVRVAVADALRNYKTKDVARALTDVLEDRQFEVAWQARQSLVLMTGRDFRYDRDKWREYLSGENRFG